MSDAKKQAVEPDMMQKLFELGAHLGHKKNRLFPKSRKYIYKIVNGVSVIDLTQTVTQYDEAKKVITQAAKEGKLILVVATKKIANPFVKELTEKLSLPSITNKWLPGLLTNFDTIMKNVKKMISMKEAKTQGEWAKFVKHEQVQLEKELNKLERLYGGLTLFTRRPDIMFIVDIKKEKNAVKEAIGFNIPVIAMVDTNSNPDQVMYPIIANDDSPEVVQFIVSDLLNTYAKNLKVEEK